LIEELSFGDRTIIANIQEENLGILDFAMGIRLKGEFELGNGRRKHMSKINCKQIAYYGKPIDSLTRGELISALEELAGAIHECAMKNKKCRKIIQIKDSAEWTGD
jgi:hypothetical protein